MRGKKLAIAVTLLVAVIAIILVASFTMMHGKETREVELSLYLPEELSWVKQVNRTFKVDVEGLSLGSWAKRDFTCDGLGRVPMISWERVEGAKAYTIIVYDPDAPRGVFYHMVLYNVKGTSLNATGEALPNSAGYPGWYPICPPKGHGVHRYYFLVLAQDTEMPPISNLSQLVGYLKGHVVAYGWTMLVYKR